MANYGLYFQITNNTGAPLGLMTYNMHDSCWEGPQTIPSQAKPTLVYINDCKMWEGAEGSFTYLAVINGQARTYTWYGSCPVGSSANVAKGPGITTYNGTGHPLTVTVFLDANTPGWAPFPATQMESIKDIKAQLSGKMPATEKDIVKM